MVAKDGMKYDTHQKELLMRQNGQDAILLAHRILDELMIKEYENHLKDQRMRDFSKMYTKEIFLKGVFVCAMESIFYVNVVKNTHANEIMQAINIKPFDFWRLINSFMKFDA
jgi:hypothetical protein